MIDLIKAADALADAAENVDRVNYKNDELDEALNAYRQARESSGWVNAAALSEDVEDILWDHVYADRGEIFGLGDACDKIRSRIKAALED